MQQTNTYKLDLIEPSDTFSADPLNGNAQKLEAALTGTRADLESSLAGVRSDLESSLSGTKSGLEAALAGVQASLDRNTASLSDRITALGDRATALESHKIAVGTYTGNGTQQTISLGFTPIAVLVIGQSLNSNYPGLALADYPVTSYGYQQLVIVPGGFSVLKGEPPFEVIAYNANNSVYNYLALS